VNDWAVLVVGNKRAGKTSSLCKLLAEFNAAKLSNDNVCLFAAGPKIIARGWPSFFKVSLGTIAAQPELARDIPSHLLGALENEDSAWSVYDKVALYPGQAAERFGVKLIPESEVATVIIPRFDETSAPRLYPARWGDVETEFRSYLQGVLNPNHREWIGINPVSPDLIDRTLSALLQRLATLQIPIYRLTWGPSIEDLFARVPQLWPARKSVYLARKGIGQDHDGDWPPLPRVIQADV
jgi:hypothetical protein